MQYDVSEKHEQKLTNRQHVCARVKNDSTLNYRLLEVEVFGNTAVPYTVLRSISEPKSIVIGNIP